MDNHINLDDALKMVGPGWKALVIAAYKRLPKDACIDQVKEKFGVLRIYCTGGETHPDRYADFLWNLEIVSGYICEQCGAPGEITGVGWLKTLCEECHEAQQD